MAISLIWDLHQEGPRRRLLRQDDLDVQILDDGRGEVHVPLDSGSDPIGHHQGLEFVEIEFSPFLFLADNVAEEDSFLRVLLTGIPGPLCVGIEEFDVEDFLADRRLLGGVEGVKGPAAMT